MKQNILKITAFVFFISINQTFGQNNFKSFDKKMNFWMWLYHIPGSQIVLIDDAKIEHIYTYGSTVYKGDKKINNSTKFQVGKLNQILTSLAVMKEVENGNLFWNKTINSQLRQYKLRTSSITNDNESKLIQLLNHTSGINRDYYPFNKKGVSISKSELLNGNKKIKLGRLLNFQEPLKSYLYSEGAFVLAGLLVEEQSNLDYKEYLKREVLNKKALDFKFNGSGILNRAEAHDFSKNRLITPEEYPSIYSRGSWISAKDYSEFLIDVLENKNVFTNYTKYNSYFKKAFISEEKNNLSSCVVFSKNDMEDSEYILMDKKDGYRSYFKYNTETKKGFLILLNSEYDYWLSRKNNKVYKKLEKLIKDY